MSVKQDRTAARTATDIERKYNFGKKFSEILGLIDDSRDKVDSVESTLRGEITKTATSLSRDTESIVATATAEVKSELNESITDVSGNVTELEKRVTEVSKDVELKMDAESVDIAIDKKLSNGVDRVETSTGYRFDSEGLSIRKSGEEMSNLLDNTGMRVTRSGENILVANNKGVEALNLHAKTYLIIGSGDGRSRLEDYGTNRTGVFWVG